MGAPLRSGELIQRATPMLPMAEILPSRKVHGGLITLQTGQPEPTKGLSNMPISPKQSRFRKLKFFFGLCLAAMLYAQLQFRGDNEVVLSPVSPIVLAAETVAADPFEKLIRTDPLAALMEARSHHVRDVRDYQCVMIKQEILPSGMSEEQEIDVKFRAQPYSVMMHWLRNPGLAERVIYVKDRWIDEDADQPELRQLAVAQPGKVAQMFLKSIKQPIHGTMAKKASRRYLDDFGFARTLDMLVRYCEIARDKGELKLEFRGESHFDGRPVWVVRRTLPYTGETGIYPDRIAEIYIDKELRVPVAVYCYSGDDRTPQQLLGKYEYRNVRFQAGLTEQDFDPLTYGM
jgi:hypothetical protein